jgi:hypothetical protein
MAGSRPAARDRVRVICLALPEAQEVEAWGEPTFRVRNKIVVMYANAGNHHGAGHHATWCKATPADRQLMIAADPRRLSAAPPPALGNDVGRAVQIRADPWPAVRGSPRAHDRQVTVHRHFYTIAGTRSIRRMSSRNSPAPIGAMSPTSTYTGV